jgi:hypothetical protein
MSDIKGNYGVSKNANFFIKDTIGVPHPYMIGARHVAHAADHYGGMLGKAAIESGEARGIMCKMKNCNLTYAQHETALIVGCKIDVKTDPVAKKELEKYLKSIVKEAEANGYAGFAFMIV